MFKWFLKSPRKQYIQTDAHNKHGTHQHCANFCLRTSKTVVIKSTTSLYQLEDFNVVLKWLFLNVDEFFIVHQMNFSKKTDPVLKIDPVLKSWSGFEELICTYYGKTLRREILIFYYDSQNRFDFSYWRREGNIFDHGWRSSVKTAQMQLQEARRCRNSVSQNLF